MLNLPLSNSRNKAILRANLSERRGHETWRDASLEKKRKRQRERGARDRVSDPLFARNQPRDPPFLLIPRRYRRGQLSFGGDAQQVRVYIYIYIYKTRFRETRVLADKRIEGRISDLVKAPTNSIS